MKSSRSKRQSLRLILLLISFSAFPITILYLSPGPPLMSLKAGVINLSVVVVLSIFFSAFFLRRSFCGWICPGGGCQLVAGSLNNRQLKRKKRDWIRIVLISVWVVLMVGTILFRMDSRELDLGHPGAGKFAQSNIRFFMPYIPTVIFIFLFVYIFGRRGFCHRGCWIYPLIATSTLLGKGLKFPSLHVRIEASASCNGCKLCTKNCTMSIDVGNHVQELTPLPNHCIQCGLCVDTCKNDVLSFSFG
jgi:polyferredoxin